MIVIPIALGMGFWLYEMLTSDKASDVCFGVGMVSIVVGFFLPRLVGKK